ncbi:MAG: hypothetical protein ACP5IK_03995 [Candidatus Micrarchaeia archaeon]|jgi:Mg/Co/Ni transporter MgtE
MEKEKEAKEEKVKVVMVKEMGAGVVKGQWWACILFAAKYAITQLFADTSSPTRQ